MSVKLTEDNIERLRCPPGRRDRLVFDTQQRGLAVRVTAGGSTSYLVQYTLDGRKHRCAAWFRIGHFWVTRTYEDGRPVRAGFRL